MVVILIVVIAIAIAIATAYQFINSSPSRQNHGDIKRNQCQDDIGTDLTNKMYPFMPIKSSEGSNDNINPKGTQDKDLLGDNISNGRSGTIDVVTSTKAIGICNPAGVIGILRIPVHTRLLNAG